jgi:hypothetical protein
LAAGQCWHERRYHTPQHGAEKRAVQVPAEFQENKDLVALTQTVTLVEPHESTTVSFEIRPGEKLGMSLVDDRAKRAIRGFPNMSEHARQESIADQHAEQRPLRSQPVPRQPVEVFQARKFMRLSAQKRDLGTQFFVQKTVSSSRLNLAQMFLKNTHRMHLSPASLVR